MRENSEFNTIVIGAGLVGAAIACGLARRSSSLAVLDGSDTDLRASRGNFGLIWVQGKGAECAAYARLSGIAAQQWPGFAKMLNENTGIDVGLQQTGGYDFCLEESEWLARQREMQQVAMHTQGAFKFRMLENAELRELIPQVSPRVRGASYSDQDGHVNPLYLLRALHQRMQQLGADYRANQPVSSIRHEQDHFHLSAATQSYRCERVIICAGLGTEPLARDLGMKVPLRPLRGQLLITERVPRFLNSATLQIRQTMEGSLQIGDSHEDVGLDDSTTLEVITRLATRAVRLFPRLQSVRLQRAWSALRVMTPDGVPIYQRSSEYPGAYAVSCHSGVTLAAMHAGELADWIDGVESDGMFDDFSTQRFNVSLN